jgi:hypothetical protein
MPAADPVPVAAEPHITGRGRNADHVDLRRRRRDRDHAARVVTRRRSHDATAE